MHRKLMPLWWMTSGDLMQMLSTLSTVLAVLSTKQPLLLQSNFTKLTAGRD
jgi:hypothetical protein